MNTNKHLKIQKNWNNTANKTKIIKKTSKLSKISKISKHHTYISIFSINKWLRLAHRLRWHPHPGHPLHTHQPPDQMKQSPERRGLALDWPNPLLAREPSSCPPPSWPFARTCWDRRDWPETGHTPWASRLSVACSKST